MSVFTNKEMKAIKDEGINNGCFFNIFYFLGHPFRVCTYLVGTRKDVF